MSKTFRSVLSAHTDLVAIDDPRSINCFKYDALMVYPPAVRQRLLDPAMPDGAAVIALLVTSHIHTFMTVDFVGALALAVGAAVACNYDNAEIAVLIKRAECYVSVIQCDIDAAVARGSIMANSTNTVFEAINFTA